MSAHWLIVDDNESILREATEVVKSFGFTFDTAVCQEDARRLLEERTFDGVLLDLEIPIQTGRLARIQNGESLLDELVRRHAFRAIPIIIMTSHGKRGPDLAVAMMKKGASDYVTKPFPTHGNTLDQAIRDGMRRCGGTTSTAESTTSDKTFAGGSLVLRADSAELLGVKIIGGKAEGKSLAVLRALSIRHPSGSYVTLSAEELAVEIGVPGNLNTITGCVRNLRRGITRRLGKQLGIRVGDEDVIVRLPGGGYQLRESIRTSSSDTERAVTAEQILKNTTDVDQLDPEIPDAVGHDPIHTDTHDTWNERQRWVLRQVQLGCRVERNMVEEMFDVSEKTAKRDIAALVEAGHICFQRDGRGGYYCLPQVTPDASPELAR